jgi:hypothetical protein
VNGRRWFAVGLTLAAVLVGGWKNAIPGLDLASGSSAPGVGSIALAAGFAQAAGSLLAYQRTAGTFVGAELAPTAAVRLAWATDSQFCLEGGAGTGELHELGPAALLPQPGACPSPA